MITTITLNAAIDQVYRIGSLDVGGVNRISNMHQDAGGKGLNVAKVLTSLGAEVDVGGFLGGSNGEKIRRLVKEKGISEQFIPIAGESRVCLTVMETSTGKGTELLESGPVISEDEWKSMLDWLREKSKKTKWFALSGSLPKGLPDDAYAQMIDIINANGAKSVLDTSGMALRYGIEAKPFAIKPNEQEFADMVGAESLSTERMRREGCRLVEQGIGHVCLTLGGKGALFCNQSGSFQAEAPIIDLKNPVGSGDAFIGGLLYGFSSSEDDVEAYKRAIACGSVNAAHPEIGYSDWNEVVDVMKSIEINELN
ncbi:1-phosphofructokinase [Sporosarcina sp. SAFN-015]|uniref:1-phosphofructokinase n=1 Tax=Sporosarcina sp. SAFN-015 TaxID=3387274 RepID=UPI003F7F2125